MPKGYWDENGNWIVPGAKWTDFNRNEGSTMEFILVDKNNNEIVSSCSRNIPTGHTPTWWLGAWCKPWGSIRTKKEDLTLYFRVYNVWGDTRYKWDGSGNHIEEVFQTIIKEGDFNGDGKTDLIEFNPDKKFYVLTSNESVFNNKTIWGSNGTFTPDRYRFADFNGDGKTDLIEYASNANFYVWLSNGTSFEPHTLWGSNGADVYDRYELADFNGDGKSDLIEIAANGNLYIWLSNGTFFKDYTIWMENAISSPEIYRIGDFNGDGNNDLFNILNNKWYISDSVLKHIHIIKRL